MKTPIKKIVKAMTEKGYKISKKGDLILPNGEIWDPVIYHGHRIPRLSVKFGPKFYTINITKFAGYFWFGDYALEGRIKFKTKNYTNFKKTNLRVNPIATLDF